MPEAEGGNRPDENDAGRHHQGQDWMPPGHDDGEHIERHAEGYLAHLCADLCRLFPGFELASHPQITLDGDAKKSKTQAGRQEGTAVHLCRKQLMCFCSR